MKYNVTISVGTVEATNKTDAAHAALRLLERMAGINDGIDVLARVLKPSLTRIIEPKRVSSTHDEYFFQIREPHTSEKGKRFKAATACIRNATSFAEEEAGKAPYYCIAVVRCSEEDNFNRQQGRTLSRRKLLNNKPDRYALAERPTYEDALAIYTSV